MLSGLASFLFGGNQEVGSAPMASNVDAADRTLICYSTIEADGDWLLVESSRHSDVATSEEDGEDRDHPESCTGMDSLESASECSSAPPSLPSSPTPVSCLDGSWYITPPPCFTASSPAVVETSPMENLLIEHPSMSVYVGTASRLPLVGRAGRHLHHRHHQHRHHQRGQKTVAISRPTEPAEEEAIASDVVVEEATVVVTLDDRPVAARRSCHHHHPALRSNSRWITAASRGQLLLHSEGQSQKAKQEHDTQGFNHRQLERLNKAREYESIGKRHRRKNFMKQHSGMSNNRKC